MSEPENFLTRWSRRKLDAEEQAVPAATDAAPQKAAEDAEEVGSGDDPDNKAEPAPAFDPASLPSIDSINAETDITAFLKAGVPGDLRLAALRRAWVTDPAIRDFKGLAENDWDFTIPNETMGFGEIDPGLDMKKMLADVFGDKPRAEEPSPEVPPEAEQPATSPHELSVPANNVALNSVDNTPREEEVGRPREEKTAAEVELVHRNKNVAMDSAHDGPEEAPIARRRPQGGALPQ